ncbi:MAG: D-amino acid dehydrogenase large subunit [uncultured Thermomicrobiales bacterium]|uniref:D-amino acid dehydrogenase large subunit n=1 Tax=uncultured Thermomicrobiales bacterium TaxID=1645740 RepID=A0A6J4V667_9BACT|nr:MAG: D-amino acid dehydrogenase large subunit [uncultured Thermomicrobiales bacterium]
MKSHVTRRGISHPSGGLRFLSHMLALLIVFAGSGFALVGTAAAQEPSPSGRAVAAAATVNTELILDSSGSMTIATSDGEPRIDAAKRVLSNVIEAIPTDTGRINVGFRVFGHTGNNTEAGRAESCQGTELRVPIEGVNREALQAEVDAYQPVGWTPITLALTEAAQDFPAAAEGISNSMILVTDGLETCDGDPCAAATAIAEGDINAVVNVIGFGTTPEETAVLSCIAENSGGLLLSANNADELLAGLFTILEQENVIVTTGSFEVENIGGLFPNITLTGQGTGATDSDPDGGEAQVFTIDQTTGNRLDDIPVGVYVAAFLYPSGATKSVNVNIEADRLTVLRGSILELPHGAGEIYTITDLAGVLVWQDQFELGDRIWVLPDLYSINLLEIVGDPVLFSATVQCLPGYVTKIDVYTAP